MNKKYLARSLRNALEDAFAVYNDAGCGAVRFNGSEFECHAYSTRGLIDTDGLADFINSTGLPVWDAEGLAEEYVECYKWDIFKKAGIVID